MLCLSPNICNMCNIWSQCRKTGAGANKAHNYRSKPLDGPGSNADSTTLGEPTVSTNKIKVVGARRIWGTLKSSSAKTVKSVILRVCKIGGELRIKRKDRENPITGRQRWWYVHGSESTLMELEAKWDQVKVQTSWKLEPCFLAESQSTPPPSSTTTDVANTLLLTHIQPSTYMEESLPSQSPVAIECIPNPRSWILRYLVVQHRMTLTLPVPIFYWRWQRTILRL